MVSKRAILGWCLFEMGNSPFNAIIITFLFAPYFVKSIAVNPIVGTAQWGAAIGFANFIVAMLAPLIGVVADLEGRRKPWIAFFTTIVGMSVIGLWFAKPEHSSIVLSLCLIVMAVIGSEFAYVFHSSLLHVLVPWNLIAKVSGWSRGLGFLGDLCSLGIVLIFIIQPTTSLLPFDMSASSRVRLSCVYVAIWIVLFTLPLLLFTPDHSPTGIRFKKAFQQALSTLINTLRDMTRQRSMLFFLLANMAILSGLTCFSVFGGIYFGTVFHLDAGGLIRLGLVLCCIAVIGAASSGYLGNYVSTKNVLIISLIIAAVLTFLLLLTHSLFWLWALSMMDSFFIGIIAATVRSVLVQISPPEKMVQMVSFSVLSGKLSTFVSPVLASLLMMIFASQQAGMILIPFCFLMGALILRLV